MKYLLCAEPGDGLRVQEETEKGRVAILMEWNLLGSEGKTIKGNEGAGNGERLVKECSFSGGGTNESNVQGGDSSEPYHIVALTFATHTTHTQSHTNHDHVRCWICVQGACSNCFTM